MPCFECRHIRANGLKCRALAMQETSFCWFHRAARRRASPEPGEMLSLPPLEDAESIQLALGDVLHRLAAGRIDPRSATTLLYGLQIASSNLRKLRLHMTTSDLVIASDVDPDEGELAPVMVSKDYRLQEDVEAEALERKRLRQLKAAQKLHFPTDAA